MSNSRSSRKSSVGGAPKLTKTGPQKQFLKKGAKTAPVSHKIDPAKYCFPPQDCVGQIRGTLKAKRGKVVPLELPVFNCDVCGAEHNNHVFLPPDPEDPSPKKLEDVDDPKENPYKIFCSQKCETRFLGELKALRARHLRARLWHVYRYPSDQVPTEQEQKLLLLQGAIDLQYEYNRTWVAAQSNELDANDYSSGKRKLTCLGPASQNVDTLVRSEVIGKHESLHRLRLLAEKAIPTMDQTIKRALDSSPGDGHREGPPELKTMYAAMRKAHVQYMNRDEIDSRTGLPKPDYRQLKDLLRCSIFFPTLIDVNFFHDTLEKHIGHANVIMVKNRFRDDYLAKRVCGYRDVIIIIRVNGLLCEVQCHLESMYALRKGFGYRDYAMMYKEFMWDLVSEVGGANGSVDLNHHALWKGMMPGCDPLKAVPPCDEQKLEKRFPGLYPVRDKYLESYLEFDLNCDGSVDAKECLRAMKNAGNKTATKGEIEDLMLRFDKDRNQQFSFMEFMRICDAIYNKDKGLSKAMQNMDLTKKQVCALQ